MKTDFSIIESDLIELASLAMNQVADERDKIAYAMERDNGLLDFVVYRANLTFVNLENAKFYKLKVNGENPINVSYIIDGIGEEGLFWYFRSQKTLAKKLAKGGL